MSNFSMLDHVDNLKPVKGGKYTCPACSGSNFSVNKATGAYDCYDGCESRDIREAVAPWESRDRTQATPKAARPAQKRQWIYTDVEGNPCIQVNRTDDGNGKKQIYQAFWESNQWTPKASDETKANLKKSVTIYRHAEILKAIEAGQVIFWVEGEPCADLLWDLGIPATTSIGGSAAYKSNGDYSQVLTGASVVICPDRDVNGLKYADLVAEDYPEARWLYAFPDSPAWENPPKDKGLDIADWMADFNLDAPQIMGLVEDRRKASIPFTVLDGGKTSPKDSIVAAIELGLIGSDLEAKKLEIAAQLRIFPRDFNTLWTVIEREIEQRDGRSDRSDAIDGLILKKSQRLDIGRIIPAQLATPLKRRAELLGSVPEALLAVFIPALASQAKIGTKLHLNRGSDWAAKPIFWSGVVGSPATSKSPTLNVFYDPFREIQALDQERYEEELKHYLEACEKARDEDGPRVELDVPTKPVRRLVDDFTTESLATIQKDQPTDGCLLGLDELAGLLGTLGQYKSGKGSDKQKLLSLRDGKGFSVTRASGSAVMTKSTSFSLSGGIQPAVLAAQMGDFSDNDGYWSRFNWVILPLLRKQFGDVADYGAAKQLREDIVYCYGAIKDLEPVEYDLSPEAERLFRSFCSEAQDNRLGHPNLSMQVAWGKSEGQLGELALILHLLWGIGIIGQKGTPSTLVSKATFERAIELMRFFIVQTELIQELGQEVSGGEDAIFAKILELGRSKGPLKASDVKNSLHDLKKDKTKNADYIRGLFNELAAMGKGVVIGEGRSLQFRPLADGEVLATASKPPSDGDVSAVASAHGWAENDIKEMRQALANKYAEEQAGKVSEPSYAEHCETLRSIIPTELWNTIGL